MALKARKSGKAYQMAVEHILTLMDFRSLGALSTITNGGITYGS